MTTWRRAPLAVTMTFWLAGCAFGPKTIDTAHLRYNQAIKDSCARELLLNVVRLRYRETPEFLDIGGVAAQYDFEGSADFQGTLFDGPLNLRRLDWNAALAVSERPTITYAPRRGREFERQLLEPVPVATIGRLANTGWDVDRVLRVTARSLNGLENPSLVDGGPVPTIEPEGDPFRRATWLLRELRSRGAVELVVAQRETPVPLPVSADRLDPGFLLGASENGYRVEREGGQVTLYRPEESTSLAIDPAAVGSPEVLALIHLLDLDPGRTRFELEPPNRRRPAPPADPAVFPAAGTAAVHEGGHAAGTAAIHEGADLSAEDSAWPPAPVPPTGWTLEIQGRSLHEILAYLSQGVEVPEDHYERGLAPVAIDQFHRPRDGSRLVGDLFRVQVSKWRPRRADLAIPYRGHWYFIAEEDVETRSTLGLVLELIARQVPGGGESLPPLTLGVGR
jgi:hypothetical protein